jgi:arylsulfatase A-like enzyme
VGSELPSIFLVTIDTLRADHLPMYGYFRSTAPFLSEVASTGTVFDAAYSTSSWTVPALASLVSGVYPTTHRVVHGMAEDGTVFAQEVLPEELLTVAEVLRDRGYRTFAVTANAHADEEFGFGQGWDRFQCVGFAEARRVEAVVERWAEEIQEHPGPVLVWLHYFDPHLPYQMREPWHSSYDPGTTPREAAVLEETARSWPLIPDEVAANMDRYLDIAVARYDSEINYTDASIAKMMEWMPRLQDALMIISADHGEEFLEHGELGHGWNLYNETVRVPFILRPPGGSKPARSKAVVSLVDVAPTLAAAAGAAVPKQWQGRSLVDGEGHVMDVGAEERAVLAGLERFPEDRHMESLIGSRWKLVVSRRTGDRELLDLIEDPGEQSSVAASRPDDARRLEQQLDRLLAKLPGPPAPPRTHELSETQERQLRRLGYIE